MIAAGKRASGWLAAAASLALLAITQQEVLPPPTWDAPWPERDRADVIEFDHRTVRLLESDEGLPWSLEIDGRTVSYGPQALASWRASPPRVVGAPLWPDHYHRQLEAGRLRDRDARGLASYVLETGFAAVREPSGQLARVVLILEFTDACRAKHCTERKVRAFYREDRSLWFFREDSRTIVTAAQQEPAADGSLFSPKLHPHPPRQAGFARRAHS